MNNKKFNIGRQERTSAYGFTLIEVILAMMIFSIMSLSLFGVFSNGIKINERVQNQTDVHREVVWSFERISRDLENAVPYDFGSSYSERRAFEGDHKSFTIILAVETGLKVIRYSLYTPEKGHVSTTVIGETIKNNVDIIASLYSFENNQFLVREEWDFIEYLQSSQEGGELEILSPHIKSDSLEIFYSYKDNEDSDDITWNETWDDKDKLKLPWGIRMKMTFRIQPQSLLRH